MSEYEGWDDFASDMRVTIEEIWKLLGKLVAYDLITVEECQKINEILNEAYRKVKIP
jgi:hypothetical protein